MYVHFQPIERVDILAYILAIGESFVQYSLESIPAQECNNQMHSRQALPFHVSQKLRPCSFLHLKTFFAIER